MVAICWLLELQETWFVMSSVAPVEVVPIAINWLVWPGVSTACVPGIMETEVNSAVPPPPPPPVTVSVAVALTSPPKPFSLAVIVVVPAPTPVASPAALMVATVVSLDVQDTESVTF
jgi:hypothetical protein